MTYTIDLTWGPMGPIQLMYCQWCEHLRFTGDTMGFRSWVPENYPEVISVSDGAHIGDIEFTFKSEDHYHWFLLQQ